MRWLRRELLVPRHPIPECHQSGSSLQEAPPGVQPVWPGLRRLLAQAERREPDLAPPNSTHRASARPPRAGHRHRTPTARRRLPRSEDGPSKFAKVRAPATRHQAGESAQSPPPALAVWDPLAAPLVSDHETEGRRQPCQPSFRNPFKRMSHRTRMPAVLSGFMSYGSFRTHVGRSGNMSDTA